MTGYTEISSAALVLPESERTEQMDALVLSLPAETRPPNTTSARPRSSGTPSSPPPTIPWHQRRLRRPPDWQSDALDPPAEHLSAFSCAIEPA